MCVYVRNNEYFDLIKITIVINICSPMKFNTKFFNKKKTQLNVFSLCVNSGYDYVTDYVSVQDENEMFY